MFAHQIRRSRAFSLIELVIVVVIIGIIAAIAIPRMSRGASGAADSAVSANLAVLRNAIDLFQTEHGGIYPSGTTANVKAQLEGYTTEAAVVGVKGDGTAIYGPYLRSVPALPVGTNKGATGFNVAALATDVFAYSATATHGWWYNSATGDIRANTKGTETDARGVLYSAY